MIRPIVTWDLPALRRRSLPVPDVTRDIRHLVADMFDTLQEAGGVGLSAIQVGVPLRVAVLAIDGHRLALINPHVLVRNRRRVKGVEGCLSLPGIVRKVKRPYDMIVSFMDTDGQAFQIRADGLQARVIGHEMDHMDGKLIVDY